MAKKTREYTAQFYLVTGIIYALVLLLARTMWLFETTLFELNAGILLSSALVAYTLLSIRIVSLDEIGGRIVLGYPVDNLRRGLHFVPFGITRFEKHSLNVVQREIPGEPEQIWHGEPDERPKGLIIGPHGELVPQSVLPLRIPTGYPESKNGKAVSASNPLDIQATVEPHVFFRGQLEEDGYVQEFIPNIGSFAQVILQIQDTIVSVLQIEFRKRTVAKIIDELGTINDQLESRVEKLVENWGFEVKDVFIKTVGLSHGLNSALMEVGIRKAEAMARIIAAEAEKKELIRKGQGEATARKLVILAEGHGLEGVMKALGINKKQAMELVRTKAAERAIIEAKNLTIFNGNSMTGLPGIFGLADALKDEKQGG